MTFSAHHERQKCSRCLVGMLKLPKTILKTNTKLSRKSPSTWWEGAESGIDWLKWTNLSERSRRSLCTPFGEERLPVTHLERLLCFYQSIPRWPEEAGCIASPPSIVCHLKLYCPELTLFTTHDSDFWQLPEIRSTLKKLKIGQHRRLKGMAHRYGAGPKAEQWQCL